MGFFTNESIVLYIFALIWLLYGIRIVSGEHFSESIQGLVRVHKIPRSVAGSMLESSKKILFCRWPEILPCCRCREILAIGASTPELLASFIGTFIAVESATGEEEEEVDGGSFWVV